MQPAVQQEGAMQEGAQQEGAQQEGAASWSSSPQAGRWRDAMLMQYEAVLSHLDVVPVQLDVALDTNDDLVDEASRAVLVDELYGISAHVRLWNMFSRWQLYCYLVHEARQLQLLDIAFAVSPLPVCSEPLCSPCKGVERFLLDEETGPTLSAEQRAQQGIFLWQPEQPVQRSAEAVASHDEWVLRMLHNCADATCDSSQLNLLAYTLGASDAMRGVVINGVNLRVTRTSAEVEQKSCCCTPQPLPLTALTVTPLSSLDPMCPARAVSQLCS